MKWPRRGLVFTALGCLYPILWIILTCVMDAAISPPFEPKWDWEAKLEPKVPADMMYAMFPSAPNTSTYDKPNGKQVGILDRAMTNSHPETAQPWIELNTTSGSAWVRREDPVFDPPAVNGDALVTAASDAYSIRKDDQFASIGLGHKSTPSGATEYTLTIRPDDDHVEDYVYLVANGVATPVKMRKYFGPGEALSRIGYLPIAALIAAGILALPLVAWGVIGWRKRRLAQSARA